MNDQRSDFYRDYAVSLVRSGDVAGAEEILVKAEEKGISSVDLLLVNGEVKKAGKENPGGLYLSQIREKAT